MAIQKKNNLRNARQRAFTIVELLIVVVIIAILATIAILAFNGVSARAHDSNVKAGLNSMQKQIALLGVEGVQPNRSDRNESEQQGTQAILAQLKALVPSSLDASTRYPMIATLVSEPNYTYDPETFIETETEPTVTYRFYALSKSKNVIAFTETGMASNLELASQREAYVASLRVDLEEARIWAEDARILNEAVSTTDAVAIAACTAHRQAYSDLFGSRASTLICTWDVSDEVAWRSILLAPDPVAACAEYYLISPNPWDNQHTSTCAATVAQYQQYANEENQGNTRVADLESQLAMYTADSGYDTWDINVYEKQGEQGAYMAFTATRPVDSKRTSERWYVYDAQAREWILVSSGNRNNT